MCGRTPPPPEEPNPDIWTFDSESDFLAAVKPGMELCTSDFTGWADVEGVVDDETTRAVVGRLFEGGGLVHVPVSALIDIREGHCVRIDRVRRTIGRQGWEVDG